MTRLARYLGLFVIAACAVAHDAPPPPSAAPPSSEILSPDPKIRMGRLGNGMRFYIRENQKPEKRAELRLAIDVGSILEAEDQLGLAHFTEHMAFNGTKLFPKQELIDYIESVGMRFGADLNAYTSFDETVYMLQVPTDSTAILKKGFQILAEWSQNISFDGEEIDKERGVVIEEWRLGRGAGQRMFDKILPFDTGDHKIIRDSPGRDPGDLVSIRVAAEQLGPPWNEQRLRRKINRLQEQGTLPSKLIFFTERRQKRVYFRYLKAFLR